MEDHVARGLALKLNPSEACRLFPGLRISSLGAVTKTDSAGTTIGLRIVMDGTPVAKEPMPEASGSTPPLWCQRSETTAETGT